MRYVSTRGGGTPVSFREAVLAGLARDGGLFVPEHYPVCRAPDSDDPIEIAAAVLAPYGDGADLKPLLKKAWSRFDDPAIAPLRPLGHGLWLLELFHGPTLAFKDIGLQFLAALFEAFSDKPLTVLGATSGDTGAAAVDALRGRKGVKLFMLHPQGRITEFQRRQMTTAREANIFNLAVAGTFDDCQRIVKETLADQALAARFNFTTVNSINWGRIVAQSAYYWWAALRLKNQGEVRFVVPSGNFGNAFAGYLAKRSGAPISGLVVATNANDLLARTLATGRYQPGTAVATLSPAMDIQDAGNFERVLFEVLGRDRDALKGCLAALAQAGGYDLPHGAFRDLKTLFSAAAASETETLAAIREVYKASRIIIDPHSAVGYAAWRKTRPTGPTVLLATAHPAKFPEAVTRAIGMTVPLPAAFESLMERPERSYPVENRTAAFKGFLKENA